VVRGQAKFVTIVAPPTSPNTDGIHVSACTNTTIQNCNIATGDDCISIVSGSHNIEVENVYCGPGCHGISIGSLGENGATANVSQVQVKNCVMEGTTNGLRIKTWQGGKGLAYNFVYQNISMINVTNPIIIDQYYCPSSQSGPCSNSVSHKFLHDPLSNLTNRDLPIT
jgi:polygalacturonase